ncbi:metal-dependent transcriptional regulator [Sulfobacillus harzensis]|uniref:Metal-dependent transcriptional regulator n=1 Tax=Sulfobacillus harzensis TaxID=2729629 RepID=A0A7Y0L2D4_9FIRM|nr:metal-dependent transcriptional regulator [Sulfobacillus harzensis]NMP21742.1 metal-dependent transcriptional regulator [Sulfobacillus harzensis]
MQKTNQPIEPSQAGAESYLEAIFVLTTEGRPAQAARIAEYLAVTPVSVSRALSRLEKNGDLLSRVPEVRLSAQGWARAEAIVRRHRLAERWLSDKLGLSLVEAHREAERLEHALSERVEQALWEDLGRPLTCPHGNPIPGLASEPLPLLPAIPLERAQPGRYCVDRIYEQLEGLEERLQWVEDAGLLPGVSFTLESDRRVTIQGVPIEVPEAVAAQLLVREA